MVPTSDEYTNRNTNTMQIQKQYIQIQKKGTCRLQCGSDFRQVGFHSFRRETLPLLFISKHFHLQRRKQPACLRSYVFFCWKMPPLSSLAPEKLRAVNKLSQILNAIFFFCSHRFQDCCEVFKGFFMSHCCG